MAADLRRWAGRSAATALLVMSWFLVVADTPAPRASLTPSPTATPRIGQIVLTPVAGAAGSTTTVNGSGFGPNQQIVLYWDSPSRTLKAGTAGPDGSFLIEIMVPADPEGPHLVCVQGQMTCATYTVQPKPTPTPSPTPSSTPSPTPSPTLTPMPAQTLSPSASPAAVPVRPGADGGDNALSLLLRPPFVIFPILVLLAALGGAIYWIWLGRRRDGGPTLVTVDSRPDATTRARAPVYRPGPAPPVGEPPAPPPAPPPAAPPPKPPRRPNYPTDGPPDLPQAGD